MIMEGHLPYRGLHVDTIPRPRCTQWVVKHLFFLVLKIRYVWYFPTVLCVTKARLLNKGMLSAI